MLHDTATRASLERSASQLHLLASVGCAGAILVMMANLALEAAGLPSLASEMAAYLGGPIVVHYPASTVADDQHPAKTMRTQIFCERIDIALGLSPLIVGPSELTAVLFQYTLENSLQQDLSHVYLWASISAFAKQGLGQSADAIWDIIQVKAEGGHQRLTDDQVLHEEPYASVYRDLAAEIRGKVAAAREGASFETFQHSLLEPRELDDLPLAAE